jgi:hypothetical protein
MKLSTSKKLIGVLSIASLLIAAATYLVVRLNRCPANNDATLEQYRSNRPVLPGKFIINDKQKAIAAALVPLWLTWFTSPDADSGIKLKDYEIHKIDVGEWKDERFLASVTFSVLPVKCSYEEWLTGNGVESGDWVRNKFLFFTIVKESDNYKVDSVGSGP